uniref:Uncharacterized protein n=1 Tax=Glossina palpalis gambiensis TaxID=67801 RepID=A0A1B0AY03_9MUSC
MDALLKTCEQGIRLDVIKLVNYLKLIGSSLSFLIKQQLLLTYGCIGKHQNKCLLCKSYPYNNSSNTITTTTTTTTAIATAIATIKEMQSVKQRFSKRKKPRYFDSRQGSALMAGDVSRTISYITITTASMVEQSDDVKNKQTAAHKETNGQNVWLDGWIDGWMDGWMDEWMNG